MNSQDIADFISNNQHKGLKYCGYVIHKTLVPKRNMNESERDEFQRLYKEETKQWGKTQSFKNALAKFEQLYPNIRCYANYASFDFATKYHNRKTK